MKVVAGLLLFVVGATFALLPPRAVALEPRGDGVRGALHIHTSRSDGTGTADQVAAAAAQAGLAFVILTDHGDAAQEPAAPMYRHGVLCIESVEISTDQGHVLALGLPRMPFVVGGAARDVLEDVARFGGMSVLAHPASARGSLAWTGGDDGFDGLEWLNGDSEWRDESLFSLGRTLWTYWFRAPESLALVLDRPDAALSLWDRLASTRPLVAVAGSDAHARVGLRGIGEPYDSRPVAKVPGYEPVFRTFSLTVPGLRLSGNAAADAAATLAALRAGRVVSVIDALAGPGWLDFSGSNAAGRAEQGGVLAIDGRVTLRAQAPAAPGARLRLLRDGREVASAAASESLISEQPADAATYRIEVSLPSAPGQPPIPWLVSNPVYVGRRAPAPWSEPPQPEWPSRRSPLYTDGEVTGWTIEKSARADGRVASAKAVDGTQIAFRFALGGSRADNPFVALARMLLESPAGYDALLFEARAARPMRVSAQLRAPNGVAGRRWRRSVYLDETLRRFSLPFREFVPVGRDMPLDAATIQSVLFVVDDVNTALGQSGQIWLDTIGFGGGDSAGAPRLSPQVRTDSSK